MRRRLKFVFVSALLVAGCRSHPVVLATQKVAPQQAIEFLKQSLPAADVIVSVNPPAKLRGSYFNRWEIESLEFRGIPNAGSTIRLVYSDVERIHVYGYRGYYVAKVHVRSYPMRELLQFWWFNPEDAEHFQSAVESLRDATTAPPPARQAPAPAQTPTLPPPPPMPSAPLTGWRWSMGTAAATDEAVVTVSEDRSVIRTLLYRGTAASGALTFEVTLLKKGDAYDPSFVVKQVPASVQTILGSDNPYPVTVYSSASVVGDTIELKTASCEVFNGEKKVWQSVPLADVGLMGTILIRGGKLVP